MLLECVQFTNSTKYHLLCVAYYGANIKLSRLHVKRLTAHENVTAQAGTRPWKKTTFPTLAGLTHSPQTSESCHLGLN